MDLPEGTGAVELSLISTAGQVVRQYTLSGEHPIMELNLSDLPAGTYLYRLSKPEAVSKAGKLIIRK
jgi:hypothetical protein